MLPWERGCSWNQPVFWFSSTVVRTKCPVCTISVKSQIVIARTRGSMGPMPLLPWRQSHTMPPRSQAKQISPEAQQVWPSSCKGNSSLGLVYIMNYQSLLIKAKLFNFRLLVYQITWWFSGEKPSWSRKFHVILTNMFEVDIAATDQAQNYLLQGGNNGTQTMCFSVSQYWGFVFFSFYIQSWTRKEQIKSCVGSKGIQNRDRWGW